MDNDGWHKSLLGLELMNIITSTAPHIHLLLANELVPRAEKIPGLVVPSNAGVCTAATTSYCTPRGKFKGLYSY